MPPPPKAKSEGDWRRAAAVHACAAKRKYRTAARAPRSLPPPRPPRRRFCRRPPLSPCAPLLPPAPQWCARATSSPMAPTGFGPHPPLSPRWLGSPPPRTEARPCALASSRARSRLAAPRGRAAPWRACLPFNLHPKARCAFPLAPPRCPPRAAVQSAVPRLHAPPSPLPRAPFAAASAVARRSAAPPVRSSLSPSSTVGPAGAPQRRPREPRLGFAPRGLPSCRPATPSYAQRVPPPAAAAAAASCPCRRPRAADTCPRDLLSRLPLPP